MSLRSPPIRPVAPDAPDATVIAEAADALRRGGLVGFPTDTIYGVAADPGRSEAIERLYEAKGRPAHLAVPLIAASLEQVDRVGRLPELGRCLAEVFWPGPLTLVVRAHPAVSSRVRGGRDTVAVRVPDHAVARALAEALGGPVTATSANRTGEPGACSAGEVAAALGPSLELVLDGGPAAAGTPSTIVDVSQGEPVLVRDGAVPWERVLASCDGEAFGGNAGEAPAP